MPDMNDNFTPDDFTPEQAAAYAICTAVVTASELISMHWDNVSVEQQNALTLANARLGEYVRIARLPYSGQHFQDRVRRQCVMHPELIALFRRAYKNR